MGFHLKRERCSFLKENVMFLKHNVDSTGLHPAGAAIRDARQPTNITELRSFLGMVNHYGRFLDI